MNQFVNQHRAIEVLLARYVQRNRANGRVTLDAFVNYLQTHRDMKTALKTFGRHRLRRVVSHALESGAYSNFRLSKGHGIVTNDYRKQVREVNFSPTDKQKKSLGIN